MSEIGPFLVTSEYRRFAEFCDACRQYRYIGLCHGPPGVGKTLSARRYAGWDRVETLSSVWQAEDEALAACADTDTVFYTPEIVNSPRSVADGVTHLCATVRNIREEPGRRAESAAAKARAHEEDLRQQDIMLRMDWFAPLPAEDDEPAAVPRFSAPPRPPPLAPVRLILVVQSDNTDILLDEPHPHRILVCQLTRGELCRTAGSRLSRPGSPPCASMATQASPSPVSPPAPAFGRVT